MERSEIKKLRHFKEELQAMACSDLEKLDFINREVLKCMDSILNNLIGDSLLLAEDLKNYLEELSEPSYSSFRQLRTDILFSIELCLHVFNDHSD